MSERRRGICGVCEGEFDVRADGVIRQHWAPEDKRQRFNWDCSGAGKPPAIMLRESPIAAAEKRGFERAVAALRKEAARLHEAADTTAFDAYDLAADYLESLDEEDETP